MVRKPEVDIDLLNSWIKDAVYAHRAWREEAWEDKEFYDGMQADDQTVKEARDAGIDLLTINRVFPMVNLSLGQQSLNPFDIIAKGRTQEDTEIAGIMSEAIRFVIDQNMGQYVISECFKNQVVAGFDSAEICLNPDPREEKIRLARRDWKDVYWDPYGSPWFDIRSTRYVFYQPWVNVADLKALFPRKAQEIEDKYKAIAKPPNVSGSSYYQDEADTVELQIQSMVTGGGWVDRTRKRCRPAEIWFTKWEDAWFARFIDGRVLELSENLPPQQQAEIVRQAEEVVKARVRKMAVATILGKLVLQVNWSPWGHSYFPYVPFVCYTDRWNFPYGLIRQVKDQNVEINKRRSVALALLGAKKVIATADVAKTPKQLDGIYEEATKIGGFVVVEPGTPGVPVSNRIRIEDQSSLASPQIELMKISEYEINEISGENREALGFAGPLQSGKALQTKIGQSNIITASIFSNYRRSLNIMGTRIMSAIQQYWRGPKILRITDRLSGAERFVALNQKGFTDTGKRIIINNITQGKYDIIITQSPHTDTLREKNMEMIIEWIKRSPPEIIPQLITIAFELSDIPNKEKLLLKIKPLLGIDPLDENKSSQEIKADLIKELEARRQKQAEAEQVQKEEILSDIERKHLENERIKAEIYQTLANIDSMKFEKISKLTDLDIRKREQDRRGTKLKLDAFKTGMELQKEHSKIINKEGKGNQSEQA